MIKPLPLSVEIAVKVMAQFVVEKCGEGPPPTVNMLAPIIDAKIRPLVEACEAAIRYDESIIGRAVRGEVSLRENEGGTVTGDDLDALYFDWQKKARAALGLQNVP